VNISTIRTSGSIGKIRLSHPVYWHQAGSGGYYEVFG
jgi:hypothetical protein